MYLHRNLLVKKYKYIFKQTQARTNQPCVLLFINNKKNPTKNAI